jgi:hypothetical protein
MGHLGTWKILEEMIADFRKKGITIPSQIMSDLRSAKTTIRILNVEPTCDASLQKIDQYLMNVESYLVSEGQKKLGFEYVDPWLNRLKEAAKKAGDEEKKEIRFVPGMPRSQRWIRVAASAEMSTERLKKIAREMKLACETEKDGSLLVYGQDQYIKDFVKNMASEYRERTGKYRKKVHNG